jgi:hypothetical protein
LAAHHILDPDGRDRFQYFHLLVAHRLAVGARRRFHGEIRHHLEEVILDDVAHRTGLVVERAPPFHPERLGHGDLHAVDVLAAPDRFLHGVGEAEEKHVAHRSLAEIVIDAEDPVLIETREQDAIECARGGEVMAEGLLDDHAPLVGRAIGAVELLDHRAEERRRYGEIVRGTLRLAQGSLESLERRRVAVVAVDVAEQALELLERGRVEPAVLLEAGLRAGVKLLEASAAFGDADDRHIERAALDHRLERGKDLLEGEVAGRAEKYQCVALCLAHRYFAFSTCPPN